MPPDVNVEDVLLCRLIDKEYMNRPFYGSRRMVVFLSLAGHAVNRKRVQRLMRSMGLVAILLLLQRGAAAPVTWVSDARRSLCQWCRRRNRHRR